jgi:hypothetical protein
VKTLGACVVLMLVGFTCGLAVATINIAFEPKHCGEDCVNTAWTSLLTWMPICTLAFPFIGIILWSRLGRTWKKLFIISLSLTLATMTPAGSVYLYRANHPITTAQ